MLLVNGYSQNSFFTSSSVFTINHWCQSGPCGISSYHFAYDSTINGQIHHRFDDWGSVPDHAYLSESNDSIFCYRPTCNSDLLLYNFGLQVGDTFLLYYGGQPCTFNEWFVADTVSTVTLLNGQTVRYIHLNNGWRELSWIYHVGDVNYGLFEFHWVEGFDQFVCASDISGTLWLSDQAYVAAMCDSLSSTPEIKNEKSDLSIFPNPASSSLTIRWKQEIKFDQLLIRTLTGEIVKSIEIKGDHAEIDVSQLAEGLYFYTLIEKDGRFESGKLIVGHP